MNARQTHISGAAEGSREMLSWVCAAISLPPPSHAPHSPQHRGHKAQAELLCHSQDDLSALQTRAVDQFCKSGQHSLQPYFMGLARAEAVTPVTAGDVIQNPPEQKNLIHPPSRALSKLQPPAATRQAQSKNHAGPRNTPGNVPTAPTYNWYRMVVFPALSRPTMITLCSAMETALVSHSCWVWIKVNATFGFLSQRCPAPGAVARCVCVGRCCSGNFCPSTGTIPERFQKDVFHL